MRSIAWLGHTGCGSSPLGHAALVVSLCAWELGGQLVFPVSPFVEERVAHSASRKIARPARAAGDVKHSAALGVLTASGDDRLLGRRIDQGLGGGQQPSADQRPGGAEREGGGDAPPRRRSPPGASTGTGPARSATTGTNASVDQPCLAPWPPASVPWATMTSAPRSSACLASLRLVTWMISVARQAARTGSASGRGSPKGPHYRAGPGFKRPLDGCPVDGTSSGSQPPRARGCRLSRPEDAGQPVPRSRCRRRGARARPALLTAAASAPPADPPIGSKRDRVQPAKPEFRERGAQRHGTIITPGRPPCPGSFPVPSPRTGSFMILLGDRGFGCRLGTRSPRSPGAPRPP